jgi:hypothetical protein
LCHLSFSSLLALLVAGHIPTGLDESVIETATDNGTQETVAEVHEVVRSLKPGIFHDARLAAAVDVRQRHPDLHSSQYEIEESMVCS